MARGRRFRGVATAGVLGLAICVALTWTLEARSDDDDRRSNGRRDDPERLVDTNASTLIDQGRRTFRYDTFGDEVFWGDKLRLHDAIAGSKLGGVGGGVGPSTALSVGLKVDADALPRSLQYDIADGRVNLDDPATTLALLKLNAVVGVTGFFFRSSAELLGKA